MAKKLMSKGYDLTSNPMHRVFRHYLLSRFIPMGVYRGGAGLKCLLVFFITNVFGRPMYYLKVRFERQVSALYVLKNKFR